MVGDTAAGGHADIMVGTVWTCVVGIFGQDYAGRPKLGAVQSHECAKGRGVARALQYKCAERLRQLRLGRCVLSQLSCIHLTRGGVRVDSSLRRV